MLDLNAANLTVVADDDELPSQSLSASSPQLHLNTSIPEPPKKKKREDASKTATDLLASASEILVSLKENKTDDACELFCKS